jgi:MoaA/NifB/PqqE/SkfB family radical SAM enzyme
MSDNKCILPWIAVDRNPKTFKGNITFSPCCYFDGQKKYDSIKEYWNSDELKELRQSFINNEQHPGCSKCWTAEQKGIKSLRQSVNEGRFEEFKSRTESIICHEPPAQIKYTVGNQCNLSCRMCVPNSSSKVKKVWEVLNKEDNLSIDEFDWYQYVINNHRSIKYLDITGGEPFYHKNTKKMLGFLTQSGQAKNITLFIQTNLTIMNQEIIDLLKNFKKVVLRVSIDGIGKKQEYIRPGLSWNEFEKNIDIIKKEKFDIMISPSLNVLNICNFEELEAWCDKKNVPVSQPSIVDFPKEMAPHNLPVALYKFVPERFRKFLEKPIDADSLNFIRDLDNFWNTDIRKAMPEWEHAVDNLHWGNFESLKTIDKELDQYV